jgi:hypothetical protein
MNFNEGHVMQWIKKERRFVAHEKILYHYSTFFMCQHAQNALDFKKTTYWQIGNGLNHKNANTHLGVKNHVE